MEHSYTGSYGNICLKPLEAEDIEKMRLLRNRYREYFIYSDEISAEDQRRWYTKYLTEDCDYIFSVISAGVWVGAVSIYNVDSDKAEFGRLMIDKSLVARGGLGYEATKCACDIAIRMLGVHLLWLEVYENNVKAKKVYLKAGFKVTGEKMDGNGKRILMMELNRKEGT